MERLRFAPSPTGYLHVGGARTALFNYLYAKKVGGSFILRIEDTDPERSKPEYSEQILRSMKWLGLIWDEGPYYQSKRMERYREVAQYMLEKGLAYECFCTPEELQARREEARKAGKPYKYDRRCRFMSPEEKEKLRAQGIKPAIRVALPLDDDIPIEWDDLVKGHLSFKVGDLDDFVIMRSDGTPTYNFAVVVDDHDMGVTLVMRGEDHIPNTPKQIMLYRLLGWEVPKFAHLPMILGEDKTKLSKRHGAVSVEEYKKQGYLAKALFNFLALLGASYEENREIYEPEELIQLFDIKKVSSHPAVFDHSKLRHINREHIKRLSMEELKRELQPFLEERGFTLPETGWERILELLRERAYTLLDFVEKGDYFFTEDYSWEEKAHKQFEKFKDMVPGLKVLADEFEKLEDWTAEEIERIMRDVAAKLEYKPRKFFPLVRIAVSGKTVGPSLFELLEVLGKSRVIRRLRKFSE